MNEIKVDRPDQDHRAFGEGPKFDLLKTREGYFRDYDHQMMHEMYAVRR